MLLTIVILTLLIPATALLIHQFVRRSFAGADAAAELQDAAQPSDLPRAA